MKYLDFLTDLDKRLQEYFKAHSDYICCKAGCASCCQKGDYPMSQIELEYLMQGYITLNDKTKILVQSNLKNMQKGGECPFLIDLKCSVYQFRPIICRVHGLAYICGDGIVKLPYCANEGKNYSKVYKDGKVTINPVLENLDTQSLLKDFDYGEIKNLYDWLN